MSIILEKYILLNKVAVLSFVQPCSRQLLVEHRVGLSESLFKYSVVVSGRQYLYFPLCAFPLFKVWLNSVGHVWLLQGAGVSIPPLSFIFCCRPLPDSSVITIVNPTPAAPVLSAKMLPGAEHWKMPLLLFTEREKNIWFNYRVCQASMSLWWPELSWGEIKSSR